MIIIQTEEIKRSFTIKELTKEQEGKFITALVKKIGKIDHYFKDEFYVRHLIQNRKSFSRTYPTKDAKAVKKAFVEAAKEAGIEAQIKN